MRVHIVVRFGIIKKVSLKKSFIIWQFATDVKIYSYFRIYTEDNLVADIGGYLGLFLGLSVFSLFEFLEVAINNLDKKEDEKIAKENGDVELNNKTT